MKCSGCRRCEIACSFFHEGKVWPEASRIRVFMLVPGVEIPHFCSQCADYPCVDACPTKALSVNKDTGAVIVDEELCNACGDCIEACPGKIPHLHPNRRYVVICDLCGGAPQCVRVCEEARYDALRRVKRLDAYSHTYKRYAKTPEELTRGFAVLMYGKRAEEWL